MSARTRQMLYRYAVTLSPAVALFAISLFIGVRQEETDRTNIVADHARLAAASVDLKLTQLLDITTFCAGAPALTERVDLDSVAENCSRYASQIGGWVVIVETGETHRQILNSRPDAPEVLPIYPREDEHATLRALEERSRVSGAPGIAEVFTGRVYPGGILSTGQHLQLADGRDAMIYVGVPAQALSDHLAEIAAKDGSVIAIVDPSRRVVARSVGIDQTMFEDIPGWFLPFFQTGTSGTALGMPGLQAIGGNWDVGYHPLSQATGWMSVAVKETPSGIRFWAPASLQSTLTLLGLIMSALLFWVMTVRDRAASRVAEAEQLNRQKSRLLAALAHDIRSPLISLIGSLELIEERRVGRGDQVPALRGSAETLLQLVDDILELSFLGSEKLTFHPSPVDLHQLASTLCDQTRGLAERKGLALHLDFDPDLPVAVEVDRLRLQQVLSNLLTNAVKYTKEGAVTLRIRQTGASAGQIKLAFSVIDTGIGLTPDQIPRILREFGRLDRELERREQGVGLGLAIVQRILNNMGSALQVESVAGKGSTFSFCLTLPVATGAEVADAALPLADVVIIYAEDEPVIRKATARRLEEAGARVTTAVDGEDALRLVSAMTPDLLLIDLQMPGLDGAGLIRRMREIAPDRPYPLFVLTSHISGPQAAEARAVGADAVFTKPIQVAALAAAFRARHGSGGRSTQDTVETVKEADTPLLQPVIFGDIVAMMGAAQAASIVEDFAATMQADLSELEARLGRANLKQAGELAHRAKGLCQVMGAEALVRRLEDIELAADDKNTAVLLGSTRSLAECLEATTREMLSTIQSGKANRSR